MQFDVLAYNMIDRFISAFTQHPLAIQFIIIIIIICSLEFFTSA